jgi:hypothetical protein
MVFVAVKLSVLPLVVYYAIDLSPGMITLCEFLCVTLWLAFLLLPGLASPLLVPGFNDKKMSFLTKKDVKYLKMLYIFLKITLYSVPYKII